jgi:hypothetical protein
MTLSQGDEKLYSMIREGITGGLSIVHHRENERRKTIIQKVFFNKEKDDVELIPQPNEPFIMSHLFGVDFNSLYPTAYSSIMHPCNPYTDGIFYMPGPLKRKVNDSDEILAIIKEKKEIFVCMVKGHIPKEKWNTPTPGAISSTANGINFPPIIRNITFETNAETIGHPIYNFMKNNNFPINQKQRKLTQMMNTNGEFFYSRIITYGY